MAWRSDRLIFDSSLRVLADRSIVIFESLRCLRAVACAGDILSKWIVYCSEHVSGWEHYAIQMFMDGNDEAIDCF
jgi:hypothetical protein